MNKMGVYQLLLIVHIVAGAVCLVTGLVAAMSKKQRGRHTAVGEVYHAGYVIVFATAVVMAILKWSELAFLFYIALFSYGLALYGYLARKRRVRNWLPKHIAGMLGSYIGVITAVLVVNGEAVSAVTGISILFLWFLPTLIGSPFISVTISRRLRRNVK